MEIKFNCSNPGCRQRISVDESQAGKSLNCPACDIRLTVPSSVNIKFNCASCGQHIVVDVSEAGRFLRCPSCSKPLQVPGDPPKPLAPEPFSKPKPKAEHAQPAAKTSSHRGGFFSEETAPMTRLLYGWGLGVIICGMVIAGVQFRAWSALPKHMDAMLEETYFHGEILTAPVENNAETALLYVRTTEAGVGLFMVDLETLARIPIASGTAADHDRSKAIKLFGWSADDEYFAFSTILDNNQNRHVVICDGQSGRVITSFDMPDTLQTGKWLTANSLMLFDDSRKLFLFNLPSDNGLRQFGTNGLNLVCQLDSDANSPIPDSDHSIAYVKDGNLWDLTIPGGQSEQLTHLNNFLISGTVDYSPDTRKYLFPVKKDNSGDAILCQFNPYATEHPVTPVKGCGNYQSDAQWIQNGSGVAYVGLAGNRYCLGIKTAGEEQRTNLFAMESYDPRKGVVNASDFPEGRQVVRTLNVGPKSDKIYVVASVNYEPLSIWEYDAANPALREVVPPKEQLNYSHYIKPVQSSVIDPDGQTVDYYYLPPPNLKPGKKYPAVIDTYSDLGFQPNSQFLANAGIFYVTANPYGKGVPDTSTTPDDALAVYNELLENTNIDPKRIYLCGEGGGTMTVASLLEDRPELWRGAILLSPEGFQQVDDDKKMVPNIFCSMGDQDAPQIRKQMDEYAAQACAHNSLIQIQYEHARGTFFGVKELKERYQAIATFILENR